MMNRQAVAHFHGIGLNLLEIPGWALAALPHKHDVMEVIDGLEASSQGRSPLGL